MKISNVFRRQQEASSLDLSFAAPLFGQTAASLCLLAVDLGQKMQINWDVIFCICFGCIRHAERLLKY